MRTTSLFPPSSEWSRNISDNCQYHSHYATDVSPTISSNRGSPLWHGNPRLDELLCTPQFQISNPQSLPSGGQRSSRPGSPNGSSIRSIGGRHPHGAPRFDQVVPHGGYLWWYIDAISDDGQHGITIIAFVGSVFSPYYAWANQKSPADPNQYCCLNVAVYSPGKKRWTMTERGGKWIYRDEERFQIGPSQLHWDGQALIIDIHERAVPFFQSVRGQIKVYPETLFNYSVPLDAGKKHRWGPLAPTARVEVQLSNPNIRWHGHAYLDSNEGDEAIDQPFLEWDWARALMSDGSTVVIYDVREKSGKNSLLALRFTKSGQVEDVSSGPRYALPMSLWRIQRHLRSEQSPVKVIQNLEDTPFYTRSILGANWLGENIVAMHETLNIPRFSSAIVRLMLPWRMPRIPKFLS